MRSCVRRQEFWLKRKAGDADHLAWRPAKCHRCSAKWWLYNLDSQLSVSLPFDGLRSFVRQPSSPEWSASEWRLWKHITICVDQGSDGLSAVSYLKSLSSNLTCIPDWSHGGQNDYYDTLRELNLFSFWVLCMIMWNVEHGPWGDDLRWNQVEHGWAEAWEHMTLATMPLFAENLQAAIREQGGEAQVLQSSSHDKVKDAMWSIMSEGWRPKDYKTCLNRFFAARGKAATFSKWWHLTLIKFSYFCMEAGQISTAKVAKLAKPPAVKDDQRPTTDAFKPDIAERALRASAQNALVLSCLLLSDSRNSKVVLCLAEASAPLHAWHAKQNREQRDSRSNFAWLVSQLSGEFMQCVRDTLGVLGRKASLESVGFDMAAFTGGAAGTAAEPSLDSYADDDELADYLGEACLVLAGRRSARCAFLLRGWPLRMVGVHGQPSLRAEVVRDFMVDLESWEALRAQERSRAVDRFLVRSCFGDVACQQLVDVGVLVAHGGISA